MAPKRKRDQYDSSDDEPLLGKQVLPIANLPDDFHGEPMDGAQYLFTVRRDSRSLPHTTRVDNPFEFAVEASTYGSDDLKVRPTLPCEEWRATIERRFKNFRKNVAQPTIHVAKPLQSKIMPDKRDRDCWWAFLAGKSEAEWNPPKKPKMIKARDRYGRAMRGYSEEPGPDIQEETWRVNEEGEVELAVATDPTDSLPTPSGSPAPPESISTKLKPREPTPALLRHIDEKLSLHLLMYFTHWINVQLENSQPPEVTESHARWIFALLSRVDDFISADDLSLLRSLARACISLLKQMVRSRIASGGAQELQVLVFGSSDHMSERSCWIITSVVVCVWGQRDLWIDAEDALSSLA